MRNYKNVIFDAFLFVCLKIQIYLDFHGSVNLFPMKTKTFSRKYLFSVNPFTTTQFSHFFYFWRQFNVVWTLYTLKQRWNVRNTIDLLRYSMLFERYRRQMDVETTSCGTNHHTIETHAFSFLYSQNWSIEER